MGAWHQDWLSVVMWLRLRHNLLYNVNVTAHVSNQRWHNLLTETRNTSQVFLVLPVLTIAVTLTTFRHTQWTNRCITKRKQGVW
jgi:hypothetical protein